MSGNINDTNVSLLRSQVSSFVSDLQDGLYADYPSRYPELHNTSKALFDMINKSVRKDIDTGVFNSEAFLYRVDSILNLIQSVQVGELSQTKASEMVGTTLAKEYVDACKDPMPPSR